MSTGESILKSQTVGDIYHGQAKVAVKRTGSKYIVVTYWPAGIDLMPSVVRGFESPEQAEPEFQAAVARATTLITPKA